MNYKTLGRTGLSVSEIGLGCEGFIGKDEQFTRDVLSFAGSNGVNIMDLYSPNPDMQRNVGRAIADMRKDFILQAHLCTVWQNGQYKATRDIAEVRLSFESMLNHLATEYIDIGMIHYVDSDKTWQQVVGGEIMQFALSLKKEGKIRHIGLSSHNPIVALDAVKSGYIDVLMFSVNPCYDLLPGDEDVEKLFDSSSYNKPLYNLDPVREELYATCQSLGVGITVMKVFGGGELLSDRSPAGKAMTVPQCIHYALTRPAVASVMVGCHTKEELASSLAYEQASEYERDFTSVFASLAKMSWQGHCLYCGHCAPCVKGIEIANVTKFLNLCKAQGDIPETVREHYRALPHKAGECIECGACEKRCPFGVNIIENMRAANKTFGE